MAVAPPLNLKKVYAVVPARAGSKGLPNKNKRHLGGKPLFRWAYDAGMHMGIDTYVSTNDKDIAALCKEQGLKYIIRPEELSSDNSRDVEFLIHFLETLEISDDDASIVNLRPTSPLRTTQDLDRFKVEVSRTHGSIRSIEPSSFPVQKMWFKNSDGTLESVVPNDKLKELYNEPRQSLRPSFVQTGSFDSYLIKDIKSGRISGDTIHSFEQSIPTFDIDTIDDFEIAQDFFSQNSGLFEYQ